MISNLVFNEWKRCSWIALATPNSLIPYKHILKGNATLSSKWVLFYGALDSLEVVGLFFFYSLKAYPGLRINFGGSNAILVEKSGWTDMGSLFFALSNLKQNGRSLTYFDILIKRGVLFGGLEVDSG